MLSQLSGEKEAHCCLDLPTGDGGSLVVMGQTRGFRSNPVKDVVDEAVHDGHGLTAHTSVGMHLLQDLVDVDGVGLLPPAFPLLVTFGNVLLSLSGLFGGFTTGLGRHVEW